jgi:hypothetical protein
VTKEEIDEQTREDWRDLGFFYDVDDEKSTWRLVGSKEGLGRFCEILHNYANDQRFVGLSEHEHYGPYWYLKLVTWTSPEITTRSIAGTMSDFKRLSGLIREKLSTSSAGTKIVIDSEYSSENEAQIVLEVREDGFDPASADPLL